MSSTTNEKQLALIVYILYLAGLVIGISALVGVILAFVKRDSAPEWLRTHYDWQIRTFLFALLGGVVALITVWVLGLGVLIGLAVAVWYIVRTIKGLLWLNDNKPVPDPQNLLFG